MLSDIAFRRSLVKENEEKKWEKIRETPCIILLFLSLSLSIISFVGTFRRQDFEGFTFIFQRFQRISCLQMRTMTLSLAGPADGGCGRGGGGAALHPAGRAVRGAGAGGGAALVQGAGCFPGYTAGF